MQNRAISIAEGVKDSLLELIDADAPNYKLSRATAALFFLNAGIAAVQNNATVKNFSLGCAIASSLLSAHEYGFKNSAQAVSSNAMSLFSKARSYVQPEPKPQFASQFPQLRTRALS
ncbi:MAG: hypothetical protein H0W64_12280 [Gammaproteobacteria bacterium]|nr:hypothetical protein [Gammaproteobacteria bacterium]